MDFLLAKDDLHRTRFVDTPTPELESGQVLLTVDAFGLTSNNITYAMFGTAMSYWSFFPAQEGWGRIPVWGFAEVSASRHDAVELATRVYGYLPPSTELVVSPERVGAHGFIDGSDHRSALPPVYNAYLRVDSDPVYDADTEDEQMLLRPLFFTSYLIDDFLTDSGLFGASAVVLSSASSKTASALAFLLAGRPGVEVVGLTSPRSIEFARSIDVYDRVVAYEELSSLERQRAVYVDMAGDAAVRDRVHEHYGDAARPLGCRWRDTPRSDGSAAGFSSGSPARVLLRARAGRQAHQGLGSGRPRATARRGLAVVCEVDGRLA